MVPRVNLMFQSWVVVVAAVMGYHVLTCHVSLSSHTFKGVFVRAVNLTQVSRRTHAIGARHNDASLYSSRVNEYLLALL